MLKFQNIETTFLEQFSAFCELNLESALVPRRWNGGFPIVKSRVVDLELAFNEWAIESAEDVALSRRVLAAIVPKYVDFKTYEQSLYQSIDEFLAHDKGDYCLVLHPSVSSLHSSVLAWKKIKDRVSSVVVAHGDEEELMAAVARKSHRYLFVSGHDLNAVDASAVREWIKAAQGSQPELVVICPYSSGRHKLLDATVYTVTSYVGTIEDKIGEDISAYDQMLSAHGYSFGIESGLYYFDHHLAAPGVTCLYMPIKWLGGDMDVGPLVNITGFRLKYLNYTQYRGYVKTETSQEEGSILKAISETADIFDLRFLEK